MIDTFIEYIDKHMYIGSKLLVQYIVYNSVNQT